MMPSLLSLNMFLQATSFILRMHMKTEFTPNRYAASKEEFTVENLTSIPDPN